MHMNNNMLVREVTEELDLLILVLEQMEVTVVVVLERLTSLRTTFSASS